MKLMVVYSAFLVVLVSSLAPNMQGLQLFKLPNMISHVEKHFGADWTWEEMKTFVVDHYNNEKLPKDAEHNNLPFKTITVVASVLVFQEPHLPTISIQHPIEEVQQQPHFGHTAPTVDRSYAIWTPPQLS